MNMPVYKISRPKMVSQLLKWELSPEFCRESFTLKAGNGAARAIVIGTLLAMSYGASAVAATSAANAGNTGDGTLTLADPAVTSAAQAGTYTVVCTTGGADGTSKFRVEDPAGVNVGTATGGTAFTKQVKFTVAGGDTDFVEGDSFTVDVTIDIGDPENLITLWDPSATDGTERIWGVSLNALTAPDGENMPGGLALRRDAVLFAGEIDWPDGITEAEKQAAIDDLERMRLLVRA